MSRRDVTDVTVGLTPRAVAALDQACAATGDSQMDTVNRALVAYQLMLEVAERGGGVLSYQDRGGRVQRVRLTRE